MKDYYREKLAQELKKVALMQTAIEIDLKQIAKRLEYADVNSIGEVIKELTMLQEVYEDVVKDAEYYHKAYHDAKEASDATV